MVSLRSKVVLAILGSIGVLVYLVIVDLGVTAGRIHRGVTVNGIDVGGLTVLEAARELTPKGRSLAERPLLFTAPGADCRFTPRDLGWGPQVFNTAERALEVGREGAPFGALWDRLRAWVSGIEVDWSDSPDPSRLEAFLDECESRVESVGSILDRTEMERLVTDVIGEWPYQQVHDLPLGG